MSALSGELELPIMEICGSRRRSSAGISSGKFAVKTIAYTTALTVLDRLSKRLHQKDRDSGKIIFLPRSPERTIMAW
jgi:hypothetical protein